MKLYCHKCNSFVDFHTKESEETITVNGVDEKVVFTNTYCDICGEGIFNKQAEIENDSRVYDGIDAREYTLRYLERVNKNGK